MSAENAKEMVELLGDITQVGIVIEDMEKAKAGMLKVFGLKPDAESDNLYKKTWYRGEIIDAPVKAAFYNQLNVQLEFLQPVGDTDTIWHDYLDEGFRKHGHALHHLRFDVEDNDEVTKPWRSAVSPSIWKANRSLTLQRRLRTTTLWRPWASSLRR